MFPFAFSHKEGQCPKDLLLAGKWEAPGRLPCGMCPSWAPLSGKDGEGM